MSERSNPPFETSLMAFAHANTQMPDVEVVLDVTLEGLCELVLELREELASVGAELAALKGKQP